jgi:hypothetical protein
LGWPALFCGFTRSSLMSPNFYLFCNFFNIIYYYETMIDDENIWGCPAIWYIFLKIIWYPIYSFNLSKEMFLSIVNLTHKVFLIVQSIKLQTKINTTVKYTSWLEIVTCPKKNPFNLSSKLVTQIPFKNKDDNYHTNCMKLPKAPFDTFSC